MTDNHPVRLLVSASPNQPANSIFLSQQISTSQLKPAQKPTSEQTEYHSSESSYMIPRQPSTWQPN